MSKLTTFRGLAIFAAAMCARAIAADALAPAPEGHSPVAANQAAISAVALGTAHADRTPARAALSARRLHRSANGTLDLICEYAGVDATFDIVSARGSCAPSLDVQ